ncbi:PLC-like phosphodiesterase [Coprinopsis marcescibilis]|uniref:PLC-like phosphodiesterase n=1 Tax=Coprinopsis marcescibilis TaxID=230819 RepID=A0A5C3KYT5_COPMA|nr:PLC-like phosphodiesterase [Coprinopsis marcescibilis]
MKFDIYNLTDETITVSSSRDEAAAFVYLQPQKPSSAPQGTRKRLYLHRSTPGARTVSSVSSQQLKLQATYEIQLPGAWTRRKGSWKHLAVAEDCPWRIYTHSAAQALVVLPNRNVSSFLADMPNSMPLSSLLLPGTHETMAFYGWPISQCQEESTPLSAQLLAGIRVLDIRLAAVPVSNQFATFPTLSASPGGTPEPQPTAAAPELKLIAYHGIFPMRTPFATILSTIHTFLTSPAGKSETVVMSFKQEDFAVTGHDVWCRLLREEIMNGPGGFKNKDPRTGKRDTGMWFLENRIPKLGEVRGKVVMFSRFYGDVDNWEGGYEGMGIHPTTWPNSEKRGFVWDLKGTTVRTHDWYAIPSFLEIPEKVSLSTAVLYPNMHIPLNFPISQPPDVVPPGPQLNITFLSAAGFPLALPPAIAKGFGWPAWHLGIEGVNSRVARWLIEEFVPDLQSIPKPQLQARARANTKVNTATKDGPVDPDQVYAQKSKLNLRFRFSRTARHVEEDEQKIIAAVDNGAAKDGGVPTVVDGADVNNSNGETQVLPALTAASRRLRGWVMLDYYASDPGLVPLLIECNYRARRSGEEGWP